MDNHQQEAMMMQIMSEVQLLREEVKQLKDNRLCRESAWDVDDEGDIRSIADLWDEERDDYDWP